MPIYKYFQKSTGRGGWRVTVSRVVDGRLVRRSKVVYAQRHVAAQWETRLLQEIESAPFARAGVVSFGQVIDAYLSHSKLANHSPETSEHRVKPLLEFFGGGKGARDILPDDVLRYRKWRAGRVGRTGRKIAPATIDREHAALKAAYSNACRSGLLDPPYNPAQYVPLLRKPNFTAREISDDDFEKILKAASPEHRLIFFAARYLGLRRSHLLALDWSQVRDELVFPPAAKASEKALRESSKRHGTAPIPYAISSVLRDPTRSRWQKRNADGLPASGLIFMWRGKPIRDIRTAVENVAARAGVEFRFKDLRTTYATHLRRLGVSEDVRLVILGHSPAPKMAVHARYQVVTEDDIREVGKLISTDKTFRRHSDCCTLMTHGGIKIRVTI